MNRNDPKDEPDGLRCPNCGSALVPVRWTTRQRGYIQRRRRCAHCGTEFDTRERRIRTARAHI